MKRREYISPDITPLIDIVFLLLIFFLVSSVFKKRGKSFTNQSSTNQRGENHKKTMR